MSELEFRPRFRFRTPLAAEDVVARVRGHQAGERGPRAGGTGNHLTLRFPANLRRSWTPEMSIYVEPDAAGSRVRCLIGPASGIWMMFVGGYLFWSFVAIVGIALGASQRTLDGTPWGYWLILPAAVGSVIMFGMVQEGKRRSRDDMRTLKRFVDDALGCDCIRLADEQDDF